MEVPRYSNPADHFMKVLSVKYPIKGEDEVKIQTMNDYYFMSCSRTVRQESNLIKLDAPDMNSAENLHFKAEVSEQIKQLFSRSWILAKREPRLSRARLLQTVVVALFMVPVFWQLDNYSTLINVKSMTGAIYFSAVVQMFLNFLPTVIVFQAEKPVYVRERASNMYDIWIYATTKLFAELPIMVFIPFLLNCMLYFAIGYQDKLSEFL